MSKTIKIASNDRRVAELIRDCKEFTTYGAFYATEVNGLGPWDSGLLSGQDLDKFREDMSHICYVVWSYNTPIAWWTGTVRGWHIVGQRFGITTGKHQGKLYLVGHNHASRVTLIGRRKGWRVTCDDCGFVDERTFTTRKAAEDAAWYHRRNG